METVIQYQNPDNAGQSARNWSLVLLLIAAVIGLGKLAHGLLQSHNTHQLATILPVLVLVPVILAGDALRLARLAKATSSEPALLPSLHRDKAAFYRAVAVSTSAVWASIAVTL